MRLEDVTEVDLYDFDKTIVPFDTGTRFTLYCLLHYPWIIITMPVILGAGLLYLLGIIELQKFKNICFCYVAMIPFYHALFGFWKKHQKDIYDWVYERKFDRPFVIVTASPDFLIGEISVRLGAIAMISTHHKISNGRILSPNCKGKEKVRRYLDRIGDLPIDVINVYSDSFKSDQPIFSLATGKCYHIENGKPVSFNYSEKYGD